MSCRHDAAAADQHAVADVKRPDLAAARVELAALVHGNPVADPHLARMPQRHVAAPERAAARAMKEPAPPAQATESDADGAGERPAPCDQQFMLQ